MALANFPVIVYLLKIGKRCDKHEKAFDRCGYAEGFCGRESGRSSMSCAGVTPASHEAALQTMVMCQVEIVS